MREEVVYFEARSNVFEGNDGLRDSCCGGDQARLQRSFYMNKKTVTICPPPSSPILLSKNSSHPPLFSPPHSSPLPLLAHSCPTLLPHCPLFSLLPPTLFRTLNPTLCLCLSSPLLSSPLQRFSSLPPSPSHTWRSSMIHNGDIRRPPTALRMQEFHSLFFERKF